MLLSAFAYLGLQALLLAGVHRDSGGSQTGTGGGAFVEVAVGTPRVQLHFEGVPVISIPQRASAFYGQATPAVGIVDGALRYALTPQWSVGIGGAVINQRTPLPNLSQVVGSRLAGMRYEVLYQRALRGPHFVQAYIGVSPRLTGADHYIYSDGTPAANKDEMASAIDATVAWGIRRAESEMLIGLRAINFSARFTATNGAADRNAGVGVVIEWRRIFAHGAP